MLCLSLWRPCAAAFFYPPENLYKGLENRDWPPPSELIGQRIALHSGKKIDQELDDFLRMALAMPKRSPLEQPPPHWLNEGVIGTVKIIGWMAGRTWGEAIRWNSIYGGEEARAWVAQHPEQQRWYIGRFAWICAERKLLPNPIPCRGHQKLWDLSRELNPEQILALEAP